MSSRTIDSLPAEFIDILPLAGLNIRKKKAAAAKKIEQNRYSFRGASLDIQTITDHEWIISGPAETSKTVACCERLRTLSVETPNAHGAIVRKVKADSATTVRRSWETTLTRNGTNVRILGKEHPETYIFDNGTRIELLGLDRPGTSLSAEYDWIYVNQAEEVSLKDWALLSSRTTGRGAVSKTPMTFGDCNPGPPSHWILKRASPIYGSDRAAQLRLLYSKHQDNPSLYDDAGELTEQGRRTIGILDGLPGVMRSRLFLGHWVQAEGVVYDQFNRETHMIKRADLPQMKRYIGGIDFGLRDPFVFHIWGIDGEGRMYLLHELYKSETLVQDHAPQIKRMCEPYSMEIILADPADAEGRATLERHGVQTSPADKEVLNGIQAAQERFRVQPDGFPRVFFVEDALDERDERLAAAHRPVCLTQELEVYSWRKDASGIVKRELPLDKDNHSADVLRYVSLYLDGGCAKWEDADDVGFDQMIYSTPSIFGGNEEIDA